MMSLSHNKT